MSEDLMKKFGLIEENEENEIIESMEMLPKEIDESEGNWIEIDTNDLASMFGDYILFSQNEFQNQLTNEDFNYEVFDTDYYAMKFPHFDESVHKILSDVSREKIIDLRNKNELFKDKKEVDDLTFRPFNEK